MDALKQSRKQIQPETSRVTRLAQQLTFARSIAGYCTADTDYRATLYPHLTQEANRYGMDESVLANFITEVVAQWREWGTMIDIKTDSSHSLPKSIPPLQKGLKTLLADDDPVLLSRLASQLGARGHQVEICRNGEIALKLVVEHKIQMVIIGRRMQSLDGLALCKSLRATAFGKSLYLILLTATESENALVEAFNSGIDDYVTKPVNMRVLLARIRAGQRIIKLQQELWQEHKEIEKASAKLALANRRLEHIAHTDLLTGLPNRRYALGRLEQEWAIAQRSKLPLSVLMMDMDHFKSVNDTLGHDAGDIVLEHTAKVIGKAKRTGDIACRLGGEEFLVIAANTDDTSALLLAERIRSSIENTQPKKLALARPITISIGVAGSSNGNPDWKELIKLADQALYRAKQNGRNSVELALL